MSVYALHAVPVFRGIQPNFCSVSHKQNKKRKIQIQVPQKQRKEKQEQIVIVNY